MMRSRVSRRIVGLFLIAALIPTLLLGSLTYRTIQNSISQQQEKELVEASRSYALTVFGRMMFARSVATGLAGTDRVQTASVVADRLFVRVSAVENGIRESSAPSTVAMSGQAAPPKAVPDGSALPVRPLVQPPRTSDEPAPVSFAIGNPAQGNKTVLAQLQPAYLWGDRDDISSAINICVYAADGLRLQCAYPDEAPERLLKTKNTTGAWDLYLKPEFGVPQWTFVSVRRFPAKGTALSDFLEVYGAVAASSVLLIILLSLVQIRRTMVPLEKLIAGARRIASGDFGPVDVRSKDEFGELALAVNAMSTQIKGQLTTLQTLTAIDGEMLKHLSLHDVIAMVGDTMRRLAPGAWRDALRGPLLRCQRKCRPVAVADIAQHALTLPFPIGSQVLRMTCSIGIAQMPSGIDDGHTPIERADIAMYRAKQLGRNNVQLYNAELGSGASALDPADKLASLGPAEIHGASPDDSIPYRRRQVRN